MSLYAKEDLDSRLTHLRSRSSRGLAFCVGAGLTAPQVPGVDDALAWMRARFTSESDRRAFDASVHDKQGGLAYQAGASFVLGRRGQSDLNHLVRLLVLNAHRPTLEALAAGTLSDDAITPEDCTAAERDLDSWYLPAKVDALAQLVVANPSYAPGPVITTNFDPLLEIAIRRAGGVAVTQILDADGAIGDVEVGEGTLVVHMHGFWRSGDTLHVNPQLTRKRNLVQSSLEDLLRERTVLVTAYGGWDDAFTGALVEAVRRHRHGDLDVLWTFLEDDATDIRSRYVTLLDECDSVPGRVTFYRGVDCEILFGSLSRATPDPGEASPAAESWTSPLEAWTAVTPELLETPAGGLSSDELVRFFDGQIPTWKHASASTIPTLASTAAVISAIESVCEHPRLAVHFVSGPAGEGKSTLARQVAAHFARSGPSWRVLWREPGAWGDPDPTSLEAGAWHWLLVVDDADTAARTCFEMSRRIHELGRCDVQIVLVARDADWRAARGQALPWTQYATWETHRVRGLSDADALMVVDAWAGAGSYGLGQLATEPDPQARANALLEAARDEGGGPDGSFIGAMLRVRIGEGLRDHVRTLMTRLRDRTINKSRGDLLEAFLYVACLHARNVLTLPPSALGDALDVDPSDLYRDVIWHLGEEAAVVQAGAYVVVRHRAIAETAMSLAPELGEDVGRLYYTIIRAALRMRQRGEYVVDLPAIVYVATRLTDTPAVAVQAARAPVDQEPDRMSFRTTLCKTLRQAGRAADAMVLARESYELRDDMSDGRKKLRIHLYEWGVCAGVSGMPALNALLALISLSDLENTDPIGTQDESPADQSRDFSIRFALNGVEHGLTRLAERTGAESWNDALEAARSVKAAASSGRTAAASVVDQLEALSGLPSRLVKHVEGDLPPDLASPTERLPIRGLYSVLGLT
jgi:hypothetical protein